MHISFEAHMLNNRLRLSQFLFSLRGSRSAMPSNPALPGLSVMSRELAVLLSTYKLWVSPINFVSKCPPLVGWRCHFASPFSVVFELFSLSHTLLHFDTVVVLLEFASSYHHATVPIPVVLLVVGSRNTRLCGIVRSAFKILTWPVSVTLSHAREWPISSTVGVSLVWKLRTFAEQRDLL